MSTQPLMVAGAEIRVAGSPIDDALFGRLLELRVQHTLMLPSTFVMTFADPDLTDVDADALAIGAQVQVLLAGPASRTLTSVLKGEVVALEPEFTRRGATLVVRGYDATHRMHRARRSRTFQRMSVADIARKVIGEHGLRAGTIADAGGALEFVQQSAETDWQLLWRLARRIDFEVVPEDGVLHFRRPRAQGDQPELTWGETLVSFRPRLTGMQQVASTVARGFDPVSGRPLAGTGSRDRLTSAPTNGSATWAGATSALADTTEQGEEATALASGLASRLGNAHVEAEGVCEGTPSLRAGTRVKIDGVGSRFGGAYRLTGVTHVFRDSGYETHFSISGTATRGLVDLMSPAPAPAFGSALAVGIVTNNDDPERLGRVRVRYPSLGDTVESAWARVAAPQAGAARGALMLPLVNDEVVVGFEGGDPRRPYVLGSVWNGQGKPEELANPDGSFSLTSPKSITVTATDGPVSVTAAKGDLSVTAEAGKIAQKASADYTIEGQTVKAKATGQLAAEGASVSVKATGQLAVEGATVSVKGNGSVTIESNGAMTVKAATLTLQGSGMVRISAPQIMLG